MEISTRWPRGGWGLEITVESGDSKITYMVDSEGEANSLADQLTEALTDLESYIKSCDPA